LVKTKKRKVLIAVQCEISKSFKPIHTRSNSYNIFTIRLTNNSVCILSAALLFWWKQNKR